jgi:hypothetical protein
MFGGKVEIRKDSDNMVVMIRMEDRRLLKMKGTSCPLIQKYLDTTYFFTYIHAISNLI